MPSTFPRAFPILTAPKFFWKKVGEYVLQGANQYAPMSGLPALREAIAVKVKAHYGRTLSAEDEVTVTSGATEAIFDAIAAVVSPGDEVYEHIVFDDRKHHSFVGFDRLIDALQRSRLTMTS